MPGLTLPAILGTFLADLKKARVVEEMHSKKSASLPADEKHHSIEVQSF